MNKQQAIDEHKKIMAQITHIVCGDVSPNVPKELIDRQDELEKFLGKSTPTYKVEELL